MDKTQLANSPPDGGDLTKGSMDILGSLKRLLQEDLSEATLNLAVRAGTALLLIIVAYFVARLLSRWVAAAMCKRVDMTFGKFLGKLTFYGLFMVAGLSILQTAGMSITSFAAVMAASGFAIGLAFQGTLSNFASGVLLLVFRPFKVGDVVQAAGVMGKINEIDLFTTTFDTPDNRRLIVPNTSIAGAIIENISFHKERRVDVVVGVAYAASLDETRAVLLAAVESLGEQLVQGEGRGYQIILSNLGASSVEWTVRFWTASVNFFAVKEQLTTQIKRQLDAHRIEIPFPQMQLHLADKQLDLRSDGQHAEPAVSSARQSGALGDMPENAEAITPRRAARPRLRVRGEH